MGLTYRTVTAKYINIDGTPMSGYVEFTPNSPLVSPGEGIIPFNTVTAFLDSTGALSVRLACTDSINVSPAGWNWIVDEKVPNGRVWWLSVPASTEPLDLLGSYNPGTAPPTIQIAGTPGPAGPQGPPGPPGSGEGGSDHGLLTGLSDDDHPQYLTEARANAKYSQGESVITTDMASKVKAGIDVGTLIVRSSTEGGAPSVRVVPLGYDSVLDMLSQDRFYVAHRCGSLNFPEATLYAASNSVSHGLRALELPLARTSDGVWFGLHDQTLLRTSGFDINPNTLTWAQVQQYSVLSSITDDITQPNQPYMRLEELLDNYGSSHVLFIDPKYNNTAPLREELLTLLLSKVPASRLVGKYYYTNTSWANDCRARGIKSWGYLYTADLPNLNTYAGAWDILGLEYDATVEAWDQVLALGKPVIGHICNSVAAVDTAFFKGAKGVMVSNVLALDPWPPEQAPSGAKVVGSTTHYGGSANGVISLSNPLESQDGDILLAIVACQASVSGGQPVPSAGWTVLAHNEGTNRGTTIFWKPWDLGPHTFTYPSPAYDNTRRVGTLVALRDVQAPTVVSTFKAQPSRTWTETVSALSAGILIAGRHAVASAPNIPKLDTTTHPIISEIVAPVTDGSVSSDGLVLVGRVVQKSHQDMTMSLIGPNIAAGASFVLFLAEKATPVMNVELLKSLVIPNLSYADFRTAVLAL